MAFDDLTPNQIETLIQLIEALDSGSYQDEFIWTRQAGQHRGSIHLYGKSGVSDHNIPGFTNTDLETLKQEGYIITSARMTALKPKAFQQYRLHTQRSQDEAHHQRLVKVEPLPLEREQEDLLSAIIEACRNMPRELREPFYVRTNDENHIAEILHKGFPDGKFKVYEGDIKVLGRYELLAVSFNQYGSVSNFDINPEGFTYYSWLKQREGEPIQKVENNLRAYLEAVHFRQKYSKAYQKWKDAEALLWESDSERQLTTIGHLCREAIQEFAEALINQYQLPNSETDKTQTVARLRAVLNHCKNQLGSTEKQFLDALLAYWGTVIDLIQRQEHGSQKEGKPLIWEDGRRVVFQTFILMFEIDSSLSS
jgi:hypothetical protein